MEYPAQGCLRVRRLLTVSRPVPKLGALWEPLAMPNTDFALTARITLWLRSGILALALALLMPQQVLAHGGGLNSAGCHNETATGGYHCHNDDDEDVDWSAVGGAVGILVVLWLLSDLWTDGDQPAFSELSFSSKTSPNGPGFVAEYEIDGLSRLGVGVEPDLTDRSGTVSQFHWRLAF